MPSSVKIFLTVALLNHQTLFRNFPIKHLGTGFSCQRLFYFLASTGCAEECNAATAASSANFCRFSAVGQGFLNQLFHLWCGDRRGESLSIWISALHYLSDFRPIVSQQSLPNIAS